LLRQCIVKTSGRVKSGGGVNVAWKKSIPSRHADAERAQPRPEDAIADVLLLDADRVHRRRRRAVDDVLVAAIDGGEGADQLDLVRLGTAGLASRHQHEDADPHRASTSR
jgi:hypothetical protein